MEKKFVPRALGQKLLSLSTMFPVVSLTGPRQSGKTTLCKALFSNYSYVNLENPDDRLNAEEDPRRFLSQYSQKGVIIDEAQKVPSLFSYLQGIVDESGQMGKYILTGSQNFLLLEKITQSLAGRVALLSLMPFDLNELTNAGFSTTHLNNIMFTGGYPAIYDRQIPVDDYFSSYIQTYVERDVRHILNIENLSTFQRFMKLCAGRTGQLLNYSSLGNDLGINYKTVKSWISILEASYIVFLLSPHHRNFNKRIVKQPKLYFYDTGLLSSLLGIETPLQLDNHYLRGNIFESFIIAEYVKARMHSGNRSNAFFWRNNTGHEIDLILEQGEQQWAVEIKSGETVNEDFFKGLNYYKKLSSIPDDHFYLVYGGNQNSNRKQGQVLSWRHMSHLPHI